MQVLVRDNNVEQALKVLKKKMQREGMFREMKRASFYENRIRAWLRGERMVWSRCDSDARRQAPVGVLNTKRRSKDTTR
jgi:small subunit ribosomal protein S21